MPEGGRDSHRGSMSTETSLQDIVLFELPTRAGAERLLRYVTPTRLSWLETTEGACIVGVFLHGEEADLALLLRHVQAWLGSSKLAAIRFELDGRPYVLETCKPALTPG
jgi:hypothetical protein